MLDKKTRNKYEITKPITNKKINYIDQFLDIPVTSKEYDFIREANKKFYLEKLIYVNEMIANYHKYYGKTIPKEIKEQQLIKVICMQEYQLKTIPLDKGTFKSELGKMIMEDMYSLHKPVIFDFSKTLSDSNSNSISKSKLDKELEKLGIDLKTTAMAIDVRDIKKWNSEKLKSRYYKSKTDGAEKLINYIDRTFKITVSQAWLKMYEICVLFKIINKRKSQINSYHICELPGNFISAINHYIHTHTNIKNFNWHAQSLNPKKKDGFGNYGYGILHRHRNRWDFGKDNTGDITKVENIKYYKKYFKDIDLLTSDCGLGWTNEEDISLKKVHFAQMLFMFYNLNRGGNFVGKFILPITNSLEINMIYLMYKSFKRLYFYKPLQNQYSSEFYIIGLHYIPVDKKITDSMFKKLSNFKKETLSKCIIRESYPKRFVHQFIKAIKDIPTISYFTWKGSFIMLIMLTIYRKNIMIQLKNIYISRI